MVASRPALSSGTGTIEQMNVAPAEGIRMQPFCFLYGVREALRD
jgi:hypothetical protein